MVGSSHCYAARRGEGVAKGALLAPQPSASLVCNKGSEATRSGSSPGAARPRPRRRDAGLRRAERTTGDGGGSRSGVGKFAPAVGGWLPTGPNTQNKGVFGPGDQTKVNQLDLTRLVPLLLCRKSVL